MCKRIVGIVVLLISVNAGVSSAAQRLNVLMIAVDDLRPEMRCYGRGYMHTPNFDRLADRGVLFERAYCNISVCGGSRSTLMSGLRPTRGRFRSWNCSTEKDAPGIETLNARFKRGGYYTVTNGKVFNNPGDCQDGWSEPDWRAGEIRYYVPANQRLHEERGQRTKGRARGPSVERSDTVIGQHRDGAVLTKSIADLKRLAASKQPFFLAVGFHKPHLPFVAPAKYWDMYNRSDIKLPATYREIPENAPAGSIHGFGEMRAYSDIPAKGAVDDEKALELIHGYYACVSMVDDLVGQLLDAVDQLGLADNTLIVLWGDHGWFLGDHTMWCKHSCFEEAMRVPLLIAGPGVQRGGRVQALVELVDIYPTLCEMSQLEAPDHLQGISFAPVLKTPELDHKNTVFGRYGNGETIRTDKYRYTIYRGNGNIINSHMLYDLELDPGETVNIADKAENAQLIQNLRKKLQ